MVIARIAIVPLLIWLQLYPTALQGYHDAAAIFTGIPTHTRVVMRVSLHERPRKLSTQREGARACVCVCVCFHRYPH